MDFSLTDERRMLRDSLTGTLSRHGADADLWPRLAALGIGQALLTPAQGGFGGEGPDIALIFRELGHAGAVTPALDSVLIGAAVLADAGRPDLAEAAAAGDLALALADEEPGGDPATRAEPDGDCWRISGDKPLVVGGMQADHLLVTAHSDADGAGVFLVSGLDVTRRGFALMSGGQGAVVGLADTPALRLGPVSLLDRPRAAAVLALCADAQGVAEAAFDLTLDYLRQRQQFCRAIGSFQAIQHRMADLAVELEQMRSAVINLAGHLDAAPDLRARHVAATKALCGQVARLVAAECIQLHGGIGMTEEYALAAMARRLLALDARFGDGDSHLQDFAALAVSA